MGDKSPRSPISATKEMERIFHHEIRNPLEMLVNSWVFLEEDSPKKEKKVVKEMCSNGNTINNILESVPRIPSLDDYKGTSKSINPTYYKYLLGEASKDIIKEALIAVSIYEAFTYFGEKSKIAEGAARSAKKIMNVASMTSMGSLSRGEIERTSELLSAKTIIKDNIHFYLNKAVLEGKAINIVFEYDGDPQIHSNKYMVDTMANYFLGNAWENSLGDIRIGARNERGMLEVISENITNGKPVRDSCGLKNGDGTIFMEAVLKDIGGKMIPVSRESQMDGYEKVKKYNTKGTRVNSQGNSWLYSRKVLIPDNLSRITPHT